MRTLHLKFLGMKQRFLLSLFALVMSIYTWAAPPAEEGKTIFQARCASCHNVNKVLVGPALAGVDQRHQFAWIVKFVQSSQGVIKSGDPAATALFEKFNHTPMPDHPDLTAAAIQGIVDYIKTESTTAAEAGKAPFAKPSRLHPAYVPVSNPSFFISMGAAIVVLMLVLLVLVRVKEYERARYKA